VKNGAEDFRERRLRSGDPKADRRKKSLRGRDRPREQSVLAVAVIATPLVRLDTQPNEGGKEDGPNSLQLIPLIWQY
jgi:hypothetical protein